MSFGGGWLGGGGGGGSSAHDAHIIDTATVAMGAPMSTDSGVADLDLEMGTAGPWYIREITVTQIGGTYSGNADSTQLTFFYDAARQNSNSAVFPFLSGALPVTVTLGGHSHDAEADDGTTCYLRLTENAFTGETVQYQVDVKFSRPRVEADG